MPKVSVIVPVYKVEKYLDECVQSICCSTLKDIEILLVDDGSPDKSGKMCERWQKKDKRIRVFHKENGGLSDARNYGIERATGNYIAFVDSDDKIAPEMLQKLFDACERYKTKISICSMCEWSSDGRMEKVCDLEDFPPMYFVDYNKEICGMYHNCAVRKLYHKSIFENPNNRFPFGILHEDIGFWWMIIAQIDKIAVVKDALYLYRQDNSGSITHAGNIKRRINDCVLSFYYGYFNGIKLVNPKKKEQYQIAFLKSYIDLGPVRSLSFYNLDKNVKNKNYEILLSLKPIALKQNKYIRNIVLSNIPSEISKIKLCFLKNCFNQEKSFIIRLFGIKLIELSIG